MRPQLDLHQNLRANAKPETGSIKTVATCQHCWLPIEKTAISQGWYHSYTGEREC